MRNGISWGSVAVGAVVGGVVTYVYFHTKEKKLEEARERQDREKEKEKKELKPAEPTKLPDEAPDPGKLGKQPGLHRPPKPDVKVWLPQSGEDRDDLDRVICDVWNSYTDTTPQMSDFTMDVLDEIAPEGDWPTVPGDHASLHSLQAIVGFRVDEISQMDPTTGPKENFNAFCIEVAVPPDEGPAQAQITPVP